MHQYQTEDFLYEALPDPIDIAIDKKVNLLYDLCILRKTKKDRKMLADEREAALREVLSEYTNEKQLDNALHNVVLGNKSLDTFLAQKGVM